jgi:predicted O-methyltransferase YrrM
MPISKNIVLNKERVDDIDLSSLHQYLAWNPQYLQFFTQKAGQEVYKLLGFISMHSSGVITDIGTQFGSSALALSLNNQVTVETYDKFKHIPDNNNQLQTISNKPNITYKILSAQAIMPKVAQSNVIYLDITTSDGLEEIKIIKKLQELNFQGILIIDDIKLSEVMENVWNNVPKELKKIDVTEFGHWSGTGIVVYNPKNIDVNIE